MPSAISDAKDRRHRVLMVGIHVTQHAPVMFRALTQHPSWILPRGIARSLTRGGLLQGLRMDLDFMHQTQCWLGLEERELHGQLAKFSQGICTAIDVGANDGFYTLCFSAKTPARKVFIFEPNFGNLNSLWRNLDINGLCSNRRPTVFPKYVGSSSGGNWTTRDSLSQFPEIPCLVNAAIDGGELELLRGAAALLCSPESAGCSKSTRRPSNKHAWKFSGRLDTELQ